MKVPTARWVAYIPSEHLRRPIEHNDDRTGALDCLLVGRGIASTVRDEIDQDHHQPRHLADSWHLGPGFSRIWAIA